MNTISNTVAKSLMIAVALTATCMVHAKKAAKTPLTDEQKAERRMQAQKRVMEMHGGILENKGKGAMAIVNCQSKVGMSALEGKIKELKRITRMEASAFDGMFNLADVKIPDAHNAALFIIDDPKLPMSLVSIEAKWGMMNVAPLYADNPDQATVETRFQKQFVRIAVLVFGGCTSQYKGSPLQPVFAAKDLDSVSGDGFTIDTMGMFIRNLGALGMTQTKRATYRKACEEGWAPAPTNEYQKAVWDKVHSAPKTPMKIKFDPKKGR